MTIPCDILVCEILFHGLILIVSVLLLMAVALNMMDQTGWRLEFKFDVISALTLRYPLICVFFRTVIPLLHPRSTHC